MAKKEAEGGMEACLKSIPITIEVNQGQSRSIE